jgi:hypothetical protein
VKKATPATELSTIRIKALSLPIEITTNQKSFLREFYNLTSAWLSPANGETPAVRFGVIQKRKYKHIEKDGRSLYPVDKDFRLCPMLMDEIINSCHELVSDYVLLHSAAVVKNGRAILLPGRAGRGKTTLTMGLINHGYRHLTDEVGAIHHKSIEVVPYQRPLCMLDWSRPMRGEVGKAFKSYRYRADDAAGSKWQYIVPQDGAAIPKDSSWKVDWIIFPRYTPNGKNELKPISTGRATLALMHRCFNEKLFPDGGLRICAELARRARCYTLEMVDLDRACELIEDLQG